MNITLGQVQYWRIRSLTKKHLFTLLHENNKKTKGHMDFYFNTKRWPSSSTAKAVGDQLAFEHGD
jgi:hypothetical protein